MHPSSFLSCENFRTKYLNPNNLLQIADVGSYDVNGTYKKVFNEPNWHYVGLDIRPGPNVDIVIEEEQWFPATVEYLKPLNPAFEYINPLNVTVPKFDVVVSGSTLEHVRKPWQWIKEVDSILKPNGLCFISVPNTWEHHDYPHDYWRVWPEGLEVLFQEVGWTTLEAFTFGEYGNDTVGIARKPS